MNIRTSFCLIATLAILTGSHCRAEKDGDLERDMETMNKAFKTLKRQVADPAQKTANLEAIARLKKSAVAARDCVPEKAETIPQAGRAKFIADFQTSISELVAQIDKLEKAVQENRIQDAQKEIDEINELKREGHSTFAGKEK
jgi:soluble cytochrome b562